MLAKNMIYGIVKFNMILIKRISQMYKNLTRSQIIFKRRKYIQ